MIDVRQSPQFANFMRDLGWQVEKINSSFIYLRKFPIIGHFAKIPRIQPPFFFAQIAKLIKVKHIFQLKISPLVLNSDKNYKNFKELFLAKNFKIDQSPFNPTTNIHIDLTQTEENIFNNFTEAKRRGVRRAIKNGVLVKESDNIDAFIKIRQKQYSPFGFLVVPEMKKLWRNFLPQNATLLIAYFENNPIAGILLLFFDQRAYYWYASALKVGKKLFAPTLLVWEALKLSKKRGCKTFDFEGIYDNRFPKAAKGWIGFTKFKEGFGGKKVTYIENFYR